MSEYTPPRQNDPPIMTSGMTDFYSNILEYYDELFPLREESISFFKRRHEEQQTSFQVQPAPFTRLLGIGCATGTLENKLNSFDIDITGIDRNPDMIATAKRRIKRASSTIRFFEMSSLDIRRFLKEGSFNIISCLENTLPYITDETLLRKFFHDSRALLAPKGMLVVQTLNYDRIISERTTILPVRSSIRVRLSRVYHWGENGLIDLDTTLELGNGRKIRSNRTISIRPSNRNTLEALAVDAGFKTCSWFGDFTEEPWTADSPYSIGIFSI